MKDCGFFLFSLYVSVMVTIFDNFHYFCNGKLTENCVCGIKHGKTPAAHEAALAGAGGGGL